jgi:hypothetical protein
LCAAAVVWRCDCRTDGGGAHAYAHATAHIGSAIGGSPIGAAGPNTTCVDTTGANTGRMGSGTAAAWTGEGLGRQAGDPDDRGCQASHDDSV